MPDVVFERRVGALRLTGLGLLALSVPASFWVLLRRGDQLAELLAPLGDAAGLLTAWGPVIGLVIASMAAFVVAAVTVARRSGRCVAGPDWLVFERALLPAWVSRTVALRSEVRDRALRPTAVHVWLRGLARAAFVVPVTTQGEAEAALLELDRAVEVEPLAAGRRSGPRETWLLLAQALFVAVCAAATGLVLDRRLGEGWAGPAFLGLALLTAPLSLCFAAALMPGARRVYVGRTGLAVGEELFTWDDLTVVGVGEGFVACAAGPRTCLAWIGADEATVRDAVAARLAEAGRPVDEVLGPLPASVSGWRRRARTLMQAAPAVLVPVGVLIAASVAPNDVCDSWVDGLGQELHVVYARDGDRPTSIVLVVRQHPIRREATIRSTRWWGQTFTGGESGLTLDLLHGTASGRRLDAQFTPGSSFVALLEDRVVSGRPSWRASSSFQQLRAPRRGVTMGWPRARLAGLATAGTPDPTSAPALLEELAAGLADEAVLAAALGWTTRRHFEVVDGQERLVWAVDRGRVEFVVRAPTTAVWMVYRNDIGFQSGPGARHDWLLMDDSDTAISVDASGGFTPDPTLPTSHADLLEVRRRVLAGERLADVLTR